MLKKYPGFEQIMETAEEQPETVGLSVSFTEAPGGGKFARVKELLSVDYVTQPAANPTGLFQAKGTASVDLAIGGTLARIAKGGALGRLLKDRKVRDRLAKVARNPVVRTAALGGLAGAAGATGDWAIDAQRAEREEARRRRRSREREEEFSRGVRVFECGKKGPGGRSILRSAGTRTQSAQPLHLQAICDAATELSAVSGPVRRPERARASSSGSNQARNQAGQFQPGPASDPETMRKVYAGPKVKRGLATRLRAMRVAKDRIRKQPSN